MKTVYLLLFVGAVCWRFAGGAESPSSTEATERAGQDQDQGAHQGQDHGGRQDQDQDQDQGTSQDQGQGDHQGQDQDQGAHQGQDQDQGTSQEQGHGHYQHQYWSPFDRFRVVPVHAQTLALERARAPIKDLATGAIRMYESLFFPDQSARCAAYAHLFRLIERQLGNSEPEQVRLATVQAVALAVASDWPLYLRLLETDAHDLLADFFKEAAEALVASRQPEAQNALLELLACMRDIVGRGDAELQQWAHRKLEAEPARTWLRFKGDQLSLSLPAPDSAYRLLAGHLVQSEALASALAQVEQRDDRATRELRRAGLEGELEAPEVSLYLPVSRGGAPESQALPPAELVDDQLALVQFARMRLEAHPDRRRPLSMAMALDLDANLRRLAELAADPDARQVFGRKLELASEPRTLAAAGRARRALDLYGWHSRLVDAAQSGLDGHDAHRCSRVAQAAMAIEAIDQEMFDVADIRRVYALWAAGPGRHCASPDAL